ncbi:MAG: polysaccharide biosynthesis protein [Candidatus Hydrothermae bacterium]|nr:polysaccharide biosynthesis protein [Candidatus Hydrothermae bacterium]
MIPRLPRNALTRALLYLLGDSLVWVSALAVALWLDHQSLSRFPVLFALLFPWKLYASMLFRTFLVPWRFFSLPDLIRVSLAALTGDVLFALAATGAGIWLDPRLFLPGMGVSLRGLALFRTSRRLFEYRRRRRSSPLGRRTLVYGAGWGAERLLRQLLEQPHTHVVGIIDDDPFKWGTRLLDIPVLGGSVILKQVVRDYAVEEVIIAIPSLDASQLQDLVQRVRRAGVAHVRVMPDVYEWLASPDRVPTPREIAVEDLLRRPPVELDLSRIASLLQNRRVWVTGAGGSIGRELVQVIARFHPAELVLVEIDETELYMLERDLQETHPNLKLRCLLADIREVNKLARWMAHHPPHVLFHAAAYKHVPMLEAHPEEALSVNVWATYHLARLAREHGVETFVYISTDKAVNPTSVMGASKRLGERVITSFHGDGHRFVAVRFGNVLGSRGSVLPLFEQQLRRGGPLTVTDPRMKRYFMLPKEAVFLVLEAVVQTDGHEEEVFVLDMGEPVRILELAENFIRLAGLEPHRDIPIRFIGTRPGEKLFEELLQAEEGVLPTRHPKVFRARLREALRPEEREEMLEQLESLLQTLPEREAWIAFLQRWVPTYRSST